MRGGNVEEMNDMARMFTSNAGKLDGIIKDLNSRTADSDRIWSGPAADRFRGDWQEARSAFEKMRQSLQEASTAVSKHAQNIEAATR
jgi:WXG100 family type VII secretion target